MNQQEETGALGLPLNATFTELAQREAKLAQFGARVLEILRGVQPIESWEAQAYTHPQALEERAKLHRLSGVESAARSLGLLGEEARP